MRQLYRQTSTPDGPAAAVVIAIALGGWFAGARAAAQDVQVLEATNGPRVVATSPVPTDAPAAEGKPAAKPADGQAPEGKPAEGDKPAAKDKSADGDKAKQEDEPTSIKRPQTPPRAPDPREFDVRPDANARVKFNFHGQLWPDVLQWFASISGASLDWQELPNDFIHLSSNRELTLPEVRDLLNRLLFDRGYTMVLQGNVLLVVKVDKIDPSLLPRVDDESELMDLPAHDLVKITFRLPEQLKADKAAEDVKPLLSANAKVQPLMATNRLLVVDLVANLREVSHLVNSEHAAAVGNTMPREFTIRFARADHVADQVMILLGLDPSSRRTPQELQVEQQRLQLFAQMQQQGKDVTKYLRSDSAPKVFLAVNHRNNSILANAPPEEMAQIERAVELLDVPAGTLTGAAPAALILRRYQLVSLKPEALVTALEDIGDLDPRTRLKMDSDARSVFVQAPPRDHEKIKTVMDELDGTGRQFEVIWLRRLPADAVAETVRKLMVGQEDEKNDDRDSYPYYFSFRRSQRSEQPPNKGFRIDADIENNRLLLWANDSELKEVRTLLVKLGEIAGEAGNPNTVRSLEPRDRQATLRLLEQLRRNWPAIGENPLRIEVQPEEVMPDAEDRDADRPAATDPELDEAQRSPPAALEPPRAAATHRRPDTVLAVTRSPSAAPADLAVAQLSDGEAAEVERPGREATEPRAEAAETIVITIGQDGQLILSSRDTRALDALEDLIARLAPPAKRYEVFYLKYALASLVTLNLEEYFEDEIDSKSDADDNFWRGWYGFSPSGSGGDKDGARGLNRRRKIRFIYDYDTNSILVSNASPEQLATVRALIEIYDKPVSEESVSARRFKIFKLRYARAEKVADTIKDVYRDLLSSKDKAFAREKDEKEQTSQSANIYRIFGSSDSEADKKPKKVKASFAGALSVGVDATSNTLIVSAQEEWLPSIEEMIEFLDNEAKPVRPTVEVFSTRIGSRELQAALSRALGESSSQVQIKEPASQPAPPPIGEQKPPAGEKAEAARTGE